MIRFCLWIFSLKCELDSIVILTWSLITTMLNALFLNASKPKWSLRCIICRFLNRICLFKPYSVAFQHSSSDQHSLRYIEKSSKIQKAQMNLNGQSIMCKGWNVADKFLISEYVAHLINLSTGISVA